MVCRDFGVMLPRSRPLAEFRLVDEPLAYEGAGGLRTDAADRGAAAEPELTRSMPGRACRLAAPSAVLFLAVGATALGLSSQVEEHAARSPQAAAQRPALVGPTGGSRVARDHRPKKSRRRLRQSPQARRSRSPQAADPGSRSAISAEQPSTPPVQPSAPPQPTVPTPPPVPAQSTRPGEFF